MFIVTNRKLIPGARGVAQFGPSPNPEGSNELRMVEATPTRAGGWSVRILPDDLTATDEGQALMAEVGIEPETDQRGKPRPVFASRYVARKVLERVNPGGRRKGRNLAFFVHGYNNDMKAVLDRAQGFADTFGVEVVAFSWPAHGGERDSALLLSRAKVGESQRARLGHHPFSLHSEQAIYVNFTGAGHVGDSHAYFEGGPLRNTAVKRFFRRALNGEAAHDGLYYQVSTGMHTFGRGERISPYAVG